MVVLALANNEFVKAALSLGVALACPPKLNCGDPLPKPVAAFDAPKLNFGATEPLSSVLGPLNKNPPLTGAAAAEVALAPKLNEGAEEPPKPALTFGVAIVDSDFLPNNPVSDEERPPNELTDDGVAGAAKLPTFDIDFFSSAFESLLILAANNVESLACLAVPTPANDAVA